LSYFDPQVGTPKHVRFFLLLSWAKVKPSLVSAHVHTRIIVTEHDLLLIYSSYHKLHDKNYKSAIVRLSVPNGCVCLKHTLYFF